MNNESTKNDPAQYQTFVKIDHEIISMVITMPSADPRRVVISYKRKYVHGVPINCLVKSAQEKKKYGKVN